MDLPVPVPAGSGRARVLQRDVQQRDCLCVRCVAPHTYQRRHARTTTHDALEIRT